MNERPEPKDYAPMWLDGGGDPTFDQIDGFLYRHFNARAVYVDAAPPAAPPARIAELEAAIQWHLDNPHAPNQGHQKLRSLLAPAQEDR